MSAGNNGGRALCPSEGPPLGRNGRLPQPQEEYLPGRRFSGVGLRSPIQASEKEAYPPRPHSDSGDTVQPGANPGPRPPRGSMVTEVRTRRAQSF
ncbi:unnamed protein product [Arctogadus glacialis]